MINIETVKQVIDGQEVNSVNLRDLWKELESKQDFSNFAKKNLEGFTVNEDYLTHDKKVERQILKEYIVTLDTAKHIVMLQRNEKGKQIRRHFIHMEEQFRLNAPATYIQALESLIEKEKELELKKIELDQSHEWFTVKRASKLANEDLAWLPLKKYSLANGYDIRKTFDQNYGEVNTYHREVYLAVYELQL